MRRHCFCLIVSKRLRPKPVKRIGTMIAESLAGKKNQLGAKYDNPDTLSHACRSFD